MDNGLTACAEWRDSLRSTKMPLTASQPHTANANTPTQKEGNALLNRLLSSTGKWLIAALVVLAAIATLNSFRYDVSIDSHASLKPEGPLVTRFFLTNLGPYSIHNVRYRCEYSATKFPVAPSDSNAVGAVNGTFEDPEVEAGGEISLHCESPLIPIDGSILQIRVSYRPSFWPLRKERSNAFTFKEDSGRRGVWLPSQHATTRTTR
jgi:hypothetical protein